MKILATSDWHIDWTTAGYERNDDLRSAILTVVDVAIRERVDLFLFLGDLCDPGANRPPRCAEEAANFATMLARENIASRWLVGNHDVIEDGSGTSTMEPLGALDTALFGSAGGNVHDPVPMIRLYDRPTVESVRGATVVALPFTPRSHGYDPREFVRGVVCPSAAPVIVIGHLNIEGIEPGSETTDMPRGRDVFFPFEEARARWSDALLLNGHYHRQQLFRSIHIPGSLARLTFGEERNTPGYLLAEVG